MRCTFCGSSMGPGTGKMYIKKTGRVFNFCSSKCEKNALKLGRKPLKTRWTRTFRKARRDSK